MGKKGFIFPKQYSFVIIIRSLEKANSQGIDKHLVEEMAGVLAGTAVWDYRRPGWGRADGFKNGHTLLRRLEAGSPRSSSQHVWCLVGAHFLVCR